MRVCCIGRPSGGSPCTFILSLQPDSTVREAVRVSSFVSSHNAQYKARNTNFLFVCRTADSYFYLASRFLNGREIGRFFWEGGSEGVSRDPAVACPSTSFQNVPSRHQSLDMELLVWRTLPVIMVPKFTDWPVEWSFHLGLLELAVRWPEL